MIEDDELPLPAPRWRRVRPRIGLDEESALPLATLAARLAAAGERAAASDAYREHLAAHPGDRDALERLAAIEKRLGRHDEEVALHRRLAELTVARAGVTDAEREVVIQFELAAIGAEDAPRAAPGAYVAARFDAMAGHFDERLRASLRYLGPEQIVARLTRRHGEGAGDLDVCDVGCGTGLLGPLLRPYARSLVGVDLSPRMLEKAADRRVYDALVAEDLVAHLEARPATYDAITAADVLVYVGDVAPFFAAARGALRQGGLLLFTVERVEGDGYALTLAGRYAHAEGYLRRAAAAADLAVVSVEEEEIRAEQGRPVRALVCVLARGVPHVAPGEAPRAPRGAASCEA
jgi:predicted TPR repeat methyltransferase